MQYSLTHLGNADLLRQLCAMVARDRANTAMMLAYIAEVDVRRLYAPRGYPSMHAFCVEELRFSDDAAFRRIRAARVARHFPSLFTALSEGRLNLASVSLLAPHVTRENLNTLIDAATHKRKIEIEQFLAENFASPEAVAEPVQRIRVIPPEPDAPPAPSLPLLAASEGDATPPAEMAGDPESVEVRNDLLVLGRVAAPQIPAPSRFHFQFVVPKSTHDKFCHVQNLLSHSVPAGDLAQVFDRALDALISQLEVRKLGVSTRELRREPSDNGTRYIPTSIRRAVWDRDRGRCTFVTITGGRCRSRRNLQFDHVIPVSRGGKATLVNLRLRCPAHNLADADRAFGIDFMRRKRMEAAVARDITAARNATGETIHEGLE